MSTVHLNYKMLLPFSHPAWRDNDLYSGMVQHRTQSSFSLSNHQELRYFGYVPRRSRMSAFLIPSPQLCWRSSLPGGAAERSRAPFLQLATSCGLENTENTEAPVAFTWFLCRAKVPCQGKQAKKTKVNHIRYAPNSASKAGVSCRGQQTAVLAPVQEPYLRFTQGEGQIIKQRALKFSKEYLRKTQRQWRLC